MSASGSRRLRIGLVSMADPDDPQAISGMPHAIKGQLLRLGHEVVNLVPAPTPGPATRLKRRVAPLVPRGLRQALKQALRQDGPAMALLARVWAREQEREGGPVDDEALFQGKLEQARGFARVLEGRIAACSPRLDAIVGVCISVPLYALEVAQPIVYFSDTTASLIVATYPRWEAQPPGWRRACEELERGALSRATRAAFATRLACRSAVEEYGVAPERVAHIPLGANVLPDAALIERARSVLPSREDLRLVITAADPERKRLDLAIDAVERLRGRGIGATLGYIGPPHPRADAHPHLRPVGRLVLSHARDRQKNLELLAWSHLMVLPSLGEAFGIAVAEAAHLARPSVVSDAGGLPEVLEDGRSAVVLPVAAGADAWAAAIEELALDPARYAAFSAAALERARGVLHWDRFGDRLGRLIEEALEG